MVTRQITNLFSLRLGHTSERFAASTGVRVVLVVVVCLTQQLHPEGPPEPRAGTETPARIPGGAAAPSHAGPVPQPRTPALAWGGDPQPSCPWDCLVAQPRFPAPRFELLLHAGVTATGAAAAPCHQCAAGAEEQSPPAPCPVAMAPASSGSCQPGAPTQSTVGCSTSQELPAPP